MGDLLTAPPFVQKHRHSHAGPAASLPYAPPVSLCPLTKPVGRSAIGATNSKQSRCSLPTPRSRNH